MNPSISLSVLPGSVGSGSGASSTSSSLLSLASLSQSSTGGESLSDGASSLSLSACFSSCCSFLRPLFCCTRRQEIHPSQDWDRAFHEHQWRVFYFLLDHGPYVPGDPDKEGLIFMTLDILNGLRPDEIRELPDCYIDRPLPRHLNRVLRDRQCYVPTLSDFYTP